MLVRYRSIVTLVVWAFWFHVCKVHAAVGYVDIASMPASVGATIDGGIPNVDNGYSLTKIGDYDGDGTDDFVTTAPFQDAEGLSKAGYVYIIYGSPNGIPTFTLQPGGLASNDGFAIYGGTANGYLGQSVAGGDFNNDGYADVVIGAPGEDNAYVVYGAIRASNSDLKVTDAGGSSRGYQVTGIAGYNFGTQVGVAGDMNGDGYDEFMISAPDSTHNGNSRSGAVAVMYGGSTNYAPVDVQTMGTAVGYVIFGEAVNDQLQNPNRAGDFNDDGLKDIIMNAPYADGFSSEANTGRAYVIYGKSGFSATNIELQYSLPSGTGFKIAGPGAGASIIAVSGIRDFNGDGWDDIAFGSPDAEGSKGAVCVVYGIGADYPPQLQLSDSLHTSGDGIYLTGPEVGARFGDTLSGVGNWNPSGGSFADFIACAPSASIPRCLVIFGDSNPVDMDFSGGLPAAFKGVVIEDTSGYKMEAVAGIGSINADVYADVAIGTPEAPNGGRSAIVYGFEPTDPPTSMPSGQPSGEPSSQPTVIPTDPTAQPSVQPSGVPTDSPLPQPSGSPTSQPTSPTGAPTGSPTGMPSTPTGVPSPAPSTRPSSQPTSMPSTPTGTPSSAPTTVPSVHPSAAPTFVPSSAPSLLPTSNPTFAPSCIAGHVDIELDPSAGTRMCGVCAAGTYSSTAGASSCTRCPLGTYNNEPGRTGCDECSWPSYTDQVGQTECHAFRLTSDIMKVAAVIVICVAIYMICWFSAGGASVAVILHMLMPMGDHLTDINYVMFEVFHTYLYFVLSLLFLMAPSGVFIYDLFKGNFFPVMWIPWPVFWLWQEGGNPTYLSKRLWFSFTQHDSIFKFIWFIVLWVVLLAVQIVDIIVSPFWIFFYFWFLIFWFLLGTFLYQSRTLAVGKIRRMWYFVWTRKDCCGEHVATVDTGMLNSSLLAGFILESIPQLIVQFMNNRASKGSWTDAALASTIMSAIMVVAGLYKFLYFRLFRGVEMKDIPVAPLIPILKVKWLTLPVDSTETKNPADVALEETDPEVDVALEEELGLEPSTPRSPLARVGELLFTLEDGKSFRRSQSRPLKGADDDDFNDIEMARADGVYNRPDSKKKPDFSSPRPASLVSAASGDYSSVASAAPKPLATPISSLSGGVDADLYSLGADGDGGEEEFSDIDSGIEEEAARLKTMLNAQVVLLNDPQSYLPLQLVKSASGTQRTVFSGSFAEEFGRGLQLSPPGSPKARSSQPQGNTSSEADSISADVAAKDAAEAAAKALQHRTDMMLRVQRKFKLLTPVDIFTISSANTSAIMRALTAPASIEFLENYSQLIPFRRELPAMMFSLLMSRSSFKPATSLSSYTGAEKRSTEAGHADGEVAGGGGSSAASPPRQAATPAAGANSSTASASTAAAVKRILFNTMNVRRVKDITVNKFTYQHLNSLSRFLIPEVADELKLYWALLNGVSGGKFVAASTDARTLALVASSTGSFSRSPPKRKSSGLGSMSGADESAERDHSAASPAASGVSAASSKAGARSATSVSSASAAAAAVSPGAGNEDPSATSSSALIVDAREETKSQSEDI